MAENEPGIEEILTGAMRCKIVAVRRQTGISLAELSERCSLSVSRLKDLENGREAVRSLIIGEDNEEIFNQSHYGVYRCLNEHIADADENKRRKLCD